MNERIKELEKAAEYWANTFEDKSRYQEYLVETFAKLIVGECMEQVWYTREDGINGNVSEVIKDRMKKHFGVEE